jgi:predicted LPLAT superfamily acyltransferase
MQYLQRLHQHQGRPGTAPDWRDGLRHFLSFADTLLDKTLALSGRYRFEKLRFSGQEPLLQMLRRGQGAVLVTAHVGCLELCQASAARQPGLKLNVLVHTAHAERFNRILRRLDPGSGVRLLQVAGVTPATAVMLAERVAQGEFVAIAGDRVPLAAGPRNTVQASFLGHEAAFPAGPYVLAALLKCPLYLLGCVREGDGHAMVFERLAEQVELPRARRGAALAEHAQAFSSRLEALVLRAPRDWFNFYPFWEQATVPLQPPP